jgi:hypothetical protein
VRRSLGTYITHPVNLLPGTTTWIAALADDLPGSRREGAMVGYVQAPVKVNSGCNPTSGICRTLPGQVMLYARADEFMAQWGSDGQRAARLSLWLDFGYMLAYGALTALLLEQVRSIRGHRSRYQRPLSRP